MNATQLQIAYPHTTHGVISSAHVDEQATAYDTDTAIDYVNKVSSNIRKKDSSGCFHVSAQGDYNLCVMLESDGIVELLFQHIPTNSTVTAKGTPRNQMKKVRQIIIEHFEGTRGFDKQIEAIYGEN